MYCVSPRSYKDQASVEKTEMCNSPEYKIWWD